MVAATIRGEEPDHAAGGSGEPVALALASDGWLYVADASRGTIATIDVKTRSLTNISPIGRRLVDLVLAPDGQGQYLFAVDQAPNDADGCLIVMRRHSASSKQNGTDLAVTMKLPVLGGPVSVVTTSIDGQLYCSVASLWSRTLSVTVLDLPGNEPAVVGRSFIVDLPFPPRRQLVLPDHHLLVADAFGGRLAYINLRDPSVRSVGKLPGHNIRGLALSDRKDEVLVAHQSLSSLAETTRDDIHWGNLMANQVSRVPIAPFLEKSGEFPLAPRSLQLDETGRGAGDPGAVVAGFNGRAAVVLSGRGELALVPGKNPSWGFMGGAHRPIRVPVGQGPAAIVLDSMEALAYVANRFDGTVSVVDLGQQTCVATIPLGPPTQVGPIALGKQLFFDARLSHEGWLSCHSCHSDGHTCGLLADTLGDGSYGTPKQILSLLGVAEHQPLGWTGQSATLTAQIDSSVRTTMQGRPLSGEQLEALTSYVQTLRPPPTLAAGRPLSDPEATIRGTALFAKHNCTQCHVPPTYTSAVLRDVGLVDENGRTAFRVPSLRGVSQRGPYLHDGRAATLREVLRIHPVPSATLEPAEIDDLLAKLNSL